MSSTKAAPSYALLSDIEVRRSIYTLANTLPIPSSRVTDIVSHAIKHCPSPFNTQSARAVLLSGDAHAKLWEMGDAMLQETLPPPAYQALAPKVADFKAAYGTVMFFEDQAPLDAMGEKNPAVKEMMPQWSEHSSGMLQFTIWTALSLEGVGCNLQHYNFNPAFTQQVRDEWQLPATWDLKSQLVFGEPARPGFERDGPRPKTYLPVEERVREFSG